MKNFFLLSSILLLLASCSTPTSSATPTENGALGTMVALTMQALTPTVAPPTATPVPPTAVPATATITPTPEPASLEITADTNCRSGPGQSYEILTVFHPKTKLEIVGRYQNNNYWVVKMPDGGECWLWGEFAKASGGFAALPERTPPPTPTPAPPAPPRGLNYSFSCTFTDVTVELTWTDVAVNEDGYRIYRNNEKVIDLPPDSSAYTDVTAASPGASFSYVVEAFNVTGTGKASISFTCP